MRRHAGDVAPALATALVALWMVLASACDRPEPEPAPPPPADTPAAPAADTSAPAVEDGVSVPFATAVALYMEAGLREIEGAGAGLSAEEFSVMADDLMFYRASAISVLERQGVRLVRREGRRPLRFVVDGEARAFDFSGRPSLDLAVLYAPDREPLAVSPVELAADPELAGRYFRSGTAPGPP